MIIKGVGMTIKHLVCFSVGAAILVACHNKPEPSEEIVRIHAHKWMYAFRHGNRNDKIMERVGIEMGTLRESVDTVNSILMRGMPKVAETAFTER
jgi:replicative superfamily II helicase